MMAHFEFNKNHGELACDWEENKHYQIAKRMVEAGGRRDIFLGCRECAGDVEPCAFGSGESYYDSLTKKVSYGFMYHGKTYADEAVLEEEKDKLTVNFWHPVMEPGGIIRFIRPERCQKRMVHDMDIKVFGDNLKKYRTAMVIIIFPVSVNSRNGILIVLFLIIWKFQKNFPDFLRKIQINIAGKQTYYPCMTVTVLKPGKSITGSINKRMELPDVRTLCFLFFTQP